MLLYGCTTWTLTKHLDKKQNWNYTRILYVVLNKSWKQLSTKQQLYGHLSPISQTKVRQARHAGHCWQKKGKHISNILLWISYTWTYQCWLISKNQHTRCHLEDLLIGMLGRKESREPVSLAYLNNDELVAQNRTYSFLMAYQPPWVI